MADSRIPSEQHPSEEADDGTPPEAVAGGSQWHPLTMAAVIGGAIAATAGAYLGTRALARRNARKDGRPVNSVMAAAITASDMAPKPRSGSPPPAENEPEVAPEPAVATEPRT